MLLYIRMLRNFSISFKYFVAVLVSTTYRTTESLCVSAGQVAYNSWFMFLEKGAFATEMHTFDSIHDNSGAVSYYYIFLCFQSDKPQALIVVCNRWFLDQNISTKSVTMFCNSVGSKNKVTFVHFCRAIGYSGVLHCRRILKLGKYEKNVVILI